MVRFKVNSFQHRSLRMHALFSVRLRFLHPPPSQNRWLLIQIQGVPSGSGQDSLSGHSRPGEESSVEPFRLDHQARINTGGKLNSSGILRCVRRSLERYFGDAGSGWCGGSLACRYYSDKTGLAIMRCARESMRIVWAAMTLMEEMDGIICRINVLHCGGTIKKTQLRAIELDRQFILRSRRNTSDALRYEKSSIARKAKGKRAVANLKPDPNTLDSATVAALEESKKEIMAVQP